MHAINILMENPCFTAFFRVNGSLDLAEMHQLQEQIAITT